MAGGIHLFNFYHIFLKLRYIKYEDLTPKKFEGDIFIYDNKN